MMNRNRILSALAALVFAAAQLVAQAPAPAADPETAKEQAELNRAIGEAGNSAVDIIRTLERHLEKYPESKLKDKIEMAILRASIDSGDGARIISYGDRILANPTNDPPLLERVARELVARGDADSAKRAVVYLKRYENGMSAMKSRPPEQHFTPGQWLEQADRALAHAQALEANALGNSGEATAAVGKALESWQTWPTPEGARQVAMWTGKLGRDAESLEWYANAFTLEDSGSTQADREGDRTHMGALYAKLHGSDQGLGDMILSTWDKMSGMTRDRAEKARLADPNARAADIFDFKLPPVNTDKPLELASLKGKTIVMDFWATWCMPCRAQHPMLENVKKRYAANKDLVFLSVDSDDDMSLAAPFLKEQGWEGPSWFEAGLERRLVIGSIPTLLVIDRNGRISSRMTGIIPDRFEQMLVERIDEALAVTAAK